MKKYENFGVLWLCDRKVLLGDKCSFLVFQKLALTLEDRDAEELILVLCGYYKLLSERDLEVIQDNSILQQQQQEAEDHQGTLINCILIENRYANYLWP